MSLKQWVASQSRQGWSQGWQEWLAFTPAHAHRRGRNKINLCERDSWQSLEGKYKTLEKFIYRIFTETGTSSTIKKKKKKMLQNGMSVLSGRHVLSQWSYVTSGACRFEYSIDMYSNWNVQSTAAAWRTGVVTTRASHWSQRKRLYEFRSQNQQMLTKTRIST